MYKAKGIDKDCDKLVEIAKEAAGDNVIPKELHTNPITGYKTLEYYIGTVEGQGGVFSVGRFPHQL